jgi:hypothetical protein
MAWSPYSYNVVAEIQTRYPTYYPRAPIYEMSGNSFGQRPKGFKLPCAKCGNPDVWVNLCTKELNNWGKPNKWFNKWFSKCEACSAVRNWDTRPDQDTSVQPGQTQQVRQVGVGSGARAVEIMPGTVNPGSTTGVVSLPGGGSASGLGGPTGLVTEPVVTFTPATKPVSTLLETMNDKLDAIHTILLNRLGDPAPTSVYLHNPDPKNILSFTKKVELDDPNISGFMQWKSQKQLDQLKAYPRVDEPDIEAPPTNLQPMHQDQETMKE